MYKKYLPILIALLLIGTPVFALSIFTVFQGGTGRSTLPASQLIYGNGLNPVGSVATTSVTCSGSTTCTSFTAIGGAPITISSTAGTGDFPFTVNTWGNSTTSTLGFLNGFLSTASSTISSALRLSSLGQGFLFTGTNGLVQPIASSSIQLSWFNNDAGFEAGLTAGDALTRTGNDFDFDGGASPGGSLGGTWASPTIDDLFILNTGDVGTGSYTFPYASSTGFSSSYASSTDLRAGFLRISGLSDGCLSIASGLVTSAGSACGSGSGSSAFEIATTSGLSVSQLAYFTKTGGMTTLGGISTSTLTAGSGLSGSFTQLGSGGSVACATANSSTFGCLTAAKFSEFDSATTTFSTGLTYSGVTNAVTVNTSQNISTLSNLTTNGLVTTSGGTGALSVTANGTNGQVLAMSGGVPTWVATTTAGTGLSYNGTSFLLNLANPNSWTALQTFNYSSSTAYSSFINASSTNLFAGNFTLSTTTAGTLKVASNGVVWSDTSGGGGGYATIQDEGSGLTVRTILNFTGSGVACADDTTKTTCTINAGAATAGGTDGQVQFNDSTALGGAVGWIWNKTKEIMGIGTTTPWTNHKVSIATSTGQNLVLLTGGNDAGIGFRNIGGSLYLSTTSPTTGATSTSATAFAVDYSSGIGKVGVGSTTPWAALGIQPSSYDYSFPLFQVATSTISNGWGTAFHVTATSSTFGANGSNGKATSDSGVRVGVGLYDYEGYGGLLDQFTVNGRINTQGWLETKCDTQQFTSLSADGQTSCHGLYFAEDGTGTATGSSGSGYGYTRIAAAINNDGAGVFLSTSHVVLSTSTPVMEVNYRIRNSTATTSQFFIGFHNRDFTSTAFETEPTIGCYFTASSTTANWRAICRTASGGANMTMVDTGIASTSSNAVNGTGYQFRKFRIQADSTKAEFFIKENESSGLKKVAQISTTYPANTSLNAGIHYGIVSINTSSGFDYFRLRYWWRDVLPSL